MSLNGAVSFLDCIVLVMIKEHWWNDTDGENQCTWRKICPIVTCPQEIPHVVVWD
jgi:hypothetical protein